jgi:alcohol dehydrogenase class IV
LNRLRLHGEEIVTGPGSLKSIGGLEFKRFFIITGQSSMFRNGTIEKIENILKEKGAEYEVFSGIGANPTTDEIIKGVEKIKGFSPECVVAVGGGSAIDAAKVIAMMYEYPEIDFEKAKTDIVDIKRKKTYLVAIPSTSGTATEVTRTAVVTFKDIDLKIGLKSYGFIPDMAILDGEVTMSMPKAVVAQTGMDAMTHAVECYTNHKLEDFSETLCIGAIEGLFEFLPSSYKEGDLNSRQKVHNYQCIAGTAFHNIGLGMDHGISHSFGGKFGYGHGLLNAVGLPYVLRYNSKDKVVKAKLEKLAKRIGADDFADAIEKLNEALDIPKSFEEMGITEIEYKENFEELLNNSMLGSTRSNPVEMNKDEMKKVLDSIFYGKILF